MNAGRILAAAGLDSHELRSELYPIRPEDVNVWPAARFVRMLWRPWIRGVTLWRLVLADPEVMRGDVETLGRFVVHELVHVRQFAEIGYARFMVRYLREYWRGRRHGKSHRDAYLAIGAEVEARALTERLT